MDYNPRTEFLFTHDQLSQYDPRYTDADPYYSASRENSAEKKFFRRIGQGSPRFFRWYEGRSPVILKILLFPAFWFWAADVAGTTTALSPLGNGLMGLFTGAYCLVVFIMTLRESYRRHPGFWRALLACVGVVVAVKAYEHHRTHERELLARDIASAMQPGLPPTPQEMGVVDWNGSPQYLQDMSSYVQPNVWQGWDN
jgi:hypothetical protein